jgi:hypothetical protein
VKELVSFLKVFVGLIGTEDSSGEMQIAVQLFATLSKLIQGNPENQVSVINAQVLSPVNLLLGNHFDGSVKSLELKVSNGTLKSHPFRQRYWIFCLPLWNHPKAKSSQRF